MYIEHHCLCTPCSFVEKSITCGILFESASRSRFCIEMCRSLLKKDTKVEILISCWKEESEIFLFCDWSNSEKQKLKLQIFRWRSGSKFTSTKIAWKVSENSTIKKPGTKDNFYNCNQLKFEWSYTELLYWWIMMSLCDYSRIKNQYAPSWVSYMLPVQLL